MSPNAFVAPTLGTRYGHRTLPQPRDLTFEALQCRECRSRIIPQQMIDHEVQFTT